MREHDLGSVLNKRMDRRTVLKAGLALATAVAAESILRPVGAFAATNPEPGTTPNPTANEATRIYQPGEVVVRGPMDEHRMFLTVDDGYSPALAKQISDYAADNGVKLTFFPVGRAVANAREVWAEVLSRGHEIGNHTWSHKNLANLTKGKIRGQLLRQEEAVKEAAQMAGFPDYQVVFMRAPYGSGRKLEKVKAVCRELDYVQAYWTIDAQGWRKSVDANMVYDRVISKQGDGKISLHHTIRDDAEALPRIIGTLFEGGYALDKTLREGVPTTVSP